MRVHVTLLGTLLAACNPWSSEIELQGVARDGVNGPGIEGVTLTAFDREFEQLAETVSEEDGWYRLGVPRGEPLVFVSLSGDGLQTTSFSGQPGENPRIRVPNSVSIAITDEHWQELQEIWQGCPGLGEQGAIFGRVEVADIVSEEGDILPVTTGVVRIVFSDGSARAACYLGEDGLYDPNASATGERAEFLLTQVPEGLQSVSVTWNPAGNELQTDEYFVWVPENGLAPRFPLLVDPPFDIEP